MPSARSVIKMTTELKGPFWKFNQSRITTAMDNASSGTAEEIRSEIQSYLGTVIKNGTGAYRDAIHHSKQGSTHLVGDGGATYGPWLESGRTRGPGGSPRRTRFKGYTAFRRSRRRVARILRKRQKEMVAAQVKAAGGTP